MAAATMIARPTFLTFAYTPHIRLFVSMFLTLVPKLFSHSCQTKMASIERSKVVKCKCE
jgi:hypothetical protein